MVYLLACSNPTIILAHSYSRVTTRAGDERTRFCEDAVCTADGFARLDCVQNVRRRCMREGGMD